MAKLFLFELISKPIKKYILAILSSTKRKNYFAMSKEINISKK